MQKQLMQLASIGARKVGFIWTMVTVAMLSGITKAMAQTSESYQPLGYPLGRQLNFQASASTIKDKVADFHNLLLVIITFIVIFVTALLIYTLVRFRRKPGRKPSKTTHNVPLEIVWTLVPVLILIIIAVPSFRLMVYTDKVPVADMTLKVTGYQWYWGYEYPDHGDISFMSYMIPEDEIQPGQKRLLEVDTPVVVPIGSTVRVLVTAADVIHSWAVPGFGVKKDAVPGRLNETWFKAEKLGTFYGQCSEICGINHAYMPIQIEVVTAEEFEAWVADQGGEMPEAVVETSAVTEKSDPILEVRATVTDKTQPTSSFDNR